MKTDSIISICYLKKHIKKIHLLMEIQFLENTIYMVFSVLSNISLNNHFRKQKSNITLKYMIIMHTQKYFHMYYIHIHRRTPLFT